MSTHSCLPTILIQVGAGIQIPPNSSRILKRWGILDKIESVSVRPAEFVLRSYRDGTVLSRQNMVPFAEDRYGAPYLHIHRADYHAILVAEARRLGVNILLGSTAVGIDFEKPSVKLAKGPEFRADVVLGADGLKSVCRQALLGRSDPPHFTGDLAYRIIIKARDIKTHPGLRELVEKPVINYWMGPNAHVVCYLLQGGGLYNIVLICPDNLPDLVSTAKADLQEMQELFQHWDPRLRALLGLVQETSKWRLQNSEEMKSWRHSAGKFALLGDACHATLPYLCVSFIFNPSSRTMADFCSPRAQGAAQAVEDGAVLGALFERLKHRSQVADALLIYERLRKERTTRVVKRSTTLRGTFHMEDGDRQKERDRQLTEQEPFENYPNPWADPIFQKWLFGYDADREVEMSWMKYKGSKFPRNCGDLR